MEEYSARGLAEIRRQKKKKRSMQKFLGFVAIVIVILGLYVSKDRWMPNFKIDNSGYTDDEITVGSFPLKIAVGTKYKACTLGERLIVLTDTRRYTYTASGDTEKVESHAYSNAILKSSDERTLMYEQNGTSLRVDSKRSLQYEKKMDDPIYVACLGSRGYTAVITQSDQYVCELHVYDNSGDEIYFRGCSQRVTDVVFKADCSGCCIVSLNVSEGNLVSEIMSVNFSSPDTEWTVSSIETCPVKACPYGENGLVLFGDTMYVCFAGDGTKVMEYPYPGALIDASCSSAGAVMMFENKERRSTTLSIITDPSTGGVTEAKLNEKFRHVTAWNDRIYMLSETVLESYGYDGKAIKALELDQPFSGFEKTGKYIYLEGHRTIEKKEF
ncbi:DUF5711 family protein [Ruminococcus sp. HUN007]|uniref:DUF5711 family protein n=1 Tax=Ruminococcus sp. HUN007 TaxID=1514668 RepID=UPI0005D1CB70|nr:DUF5711 family protein [Ruminococcus sp. HUN007]